jgi:glycosyltransferase involved in cell wall biosynthesis
MRSRAIDVPIDGVELSAFEPPLPSCDHVLNAHRVFERAQWGFALTKRFMEVQLPRAFSAAHWTWPLPVRARNVPNIYTLHDLVPLQFPHFTLDKYGRSTLLHAAIARQADHIVTVSEISKKKILELLDLKEDRVSVTYQPVPELPKVARSAAERLVESVYGVEPGKYALFLGAIEPKKNIKRLIEAFLLAGLDIPLLVAGPLGWLYEEDIALMDIIASQAQGSAIAAEAHGSFITGNLRSKRPAVRRLGYLPRRHVVALLQCARFFTFPSIYEGFGLPVIEAMQLGVPVLTSNTSSLPEVAGQAAILIDPLDVNEMAREINRLSNDTDLRGELARRGPLQAARFSWDDYSKRLAAAYRKVGVEIDNGVAASMPDALRRAETGECERVGEQAPAGSNHASA